MKLLVAARRLSADRTSEGICSSKFVAALAQSGHDVSCVTSDERSDGGDGEWGIDGASVAHLTSTAATGIVPALGRLTRRVAAAGRAGAYSARKLNGAAARATGFSVQTWSAVAQWRQALRAAIRRHAPAVVIIRGAGREFEPHLAMLGSRWPVPWVAHYHDPYPVSLYPEPYRQWIALQSPRQERAHRLIVQQASALTFPSQRLLEWVLRDELASFRHKAFVIPHIAGAPAAAAASETPAAAFAAERLVIMHTGTLLRERDPRPLLRGFLSFAERGGDRSQQVQLVFVGRVDPGHAASDEWISLDRRGLLRCIEHRVSYQAALDLSRAADVLMILEANAPESPFFPAKLADYLWLDKPILAVSPDRSATADILGTAYPLRVTPGDSQAAAATFERLWQAWRAGTLRELGPPRSLAESMSSTAVGHSMNQIFDRLLRDPKGLAA